MFGLEVADSSLSTRSGALDLTIRHLFSFVSDEDRLKLYEEICYKKYNVLFLENMFREKISYKEKYLLLDKDLCLVINDYCEKS